MDSQDSIPIAPGFVVKRQLPLDIGNADLGQPSWLAAIKALPGMLSAGVTTGDRLAVTYDASQLQIDQVLELLEHGGISLRRGYWQRHRLSWYRFVDRNTADNAQASSHCCNKPPRGY
ncbi:MAG: hypothetical protein ACI9W6_001640 [Motiliproteus sp.]|jgi:hypothetical protein